MCEQVWTRLHRQTCRTAQPQSSNMKQLNNNMSRLLRSYCFNDIVHLLLPPQFSHEVALFLSSPPPPPLFPHPLGRERNGVRIQDLLVQRRQVQPRESFKLQTGPHSDQGTTHTHTHTHSLSHTHTHTQEHSACLFRPTGLSPATRGRSRRFGFTLVELSGRPSLFIFYDVQEPLWSTKIL